MPEICSQLTGYFCGATSEVPDHIARKYRISHCHGIIIGRVVAGLRSSNKGKESMADFEIQG